MKLKHYFWQGLDYLLDSFSSRLCYGCKKAYADKANKFYCENCFVSLEIDYLKSTKNLAFTMLELDEFFASQVFHYPCINFVCEYGEFTKSLMREFKYRKPHYKSFWAELLKTYIVKNKDSIFSRLSKEQIELYDLSSIDEIELKLYLSFVPMHSAQKKQRGFNQAELLAKELSQNFLEEKFLYQSPNGLCYARITELEFLPDLFIRTKYTAKLFDKDKNQRLEILKDAFAVNLDCKLQKDSLLLVIDDITTTGASFLSLYKEIISKNIHQDCFFLAVSGRN